MFHPVPEMSPLFLQTCHSIHQVKFLIKFTPPPNFMLKWMLIKGYKAFNYCTPLVDSYPCLINVRSTPHKIQQMTALKHLQIHKILKNSPILFRLTMWLSPLSVYLVWKNFDTKSILKFTSTLPLSFHQIPSRSDSLRLSHTLSY